MIQKAKIFSFVKILLTIFLGWTLSSCDRKSSDSSKLSLVLPISSSQQKQVSALSGELAHLVVNISGPGLPGGTILQVWDQCKDCAVSMPVPNPFIIDGIPYSADPRLIQVLAVYQDSDYGMAFFYGDILAVMNQPDVSTVINLDLLNSSSAMTSGRIAGRYMDWSGGGPTGRVNIMYEPPGKPRMVIQKSSIINGWFEFFALDIINFDYVLEDGRVLFDNVNLNSSEFFANSRLLNINIPEHENSRDSVWSTEEASKLVLGWFGDTTWTASKSWCYDTGSNYQYSNLAVLGSSGATKLIASASASGSQYVSYQGGLDISDSLCQNSAVRFDSTLLSTASYIDNSHKDGAIPFELPFRKIGTNGDTFVVSNAGDTTTIQYHFLPGLAVTDANSMGKGFDGISIFKAITQNERLGRDDNEVLCERMAMGGFPEFQRIANFPVTTSSGQLDVQIPATERSMGVSLAVCPSRQGQFFNVGKILGKSYFSGGGMQAGNGGGTVVGFQVSGPMSAFHAMGTQFSTGLCIPVMVTLHNASGARTSTGSALSANFSLSGVTGLVYSDASCSTSLGVSSTFSFASGESTKLLYINVSGGSTGNLSVTIPTLSASANTYNFMVGSSMTPTTPTSSRSYLSVPDGSCQEIPIYVGVASSQFNFSSIGGSAGIVSLTMYDINNNPQGTGVGNSNGYFSTTCSSTTAISSVTIPANSFYTSVAYHAASPRTMDLKLRLTYNAVDSQDTLVNPSPLADHLTMSLSSNGSLFQGICYPLDVTARDNVNNPVVMSTLPLPLSLSSGAGVSIYYDTSCISPIAGGLNIPVSFSTKTYGVRFTQSSVGQISVNSMKVSNNAGASLNYTSTPILWSPYNLSTSVFSWLSPENIVQSGGYISSWNSSLTQSWGVGPSFSSAGVQPLYNSGWMTLNGTSEQRLSSGPLSSDYTIALLMRFNNPGSSLSGLRLLATDNERLLVSQDSTSFTLNWSGASASSMTNLTPRWRVVFLSRYGATGTNVNYQIDFDIPQAPVYGGTNLTASNINVGNTNMSYIALGSPDAGNSSAYVDIAEVIFMNGTLGGAGSATQVDIYNYFKAKYPTLGLP